MSHCWPAAVDSVVIACCRTVVVVVVAAVVVPVVASRVCAALFALIIGACIRARARAYLPRLSASRSSSACAQTRALPVYIPPGGAGRFDTRARYTQARARVLCVGFFFFFLRVLYSFTQRRYDVPVPSQLRNLGH